MAETDLSDLLPVVYVPTLLLWGDSDARSPLAVARQFEEAIPDTQLVVIEGEATWSIWSGPSRSTPRCGSLPRPPTTRELIGPTANLPGTRVVMTVASRRCAG